MENERKGVKRIEKKWVRGLKFGEGANSNRNPTPFAPFRPFSLFITTRSEYVQNQFISNFKSGPSRPSDRAFMTTHVDDQRCRRYVGRDSSLRSLVSFKYCSSYKSMNLTAEHRRRVSPVTYPATSHTARRRHAVIAIPVQRRV